MLYAFSFNAAFEKNGVYGIQRNEARLFKNYMEMCGTGHQNDGHQFNQSLQKNVPRGAT